MGTGLEHKLEVLGLLLDIISDFSIGFYNCTDGVVFFAFYFIYNS